MITELRQLLADDLSTIQGANVYNEWPSRFTPDGLIITAPEGGTYIVHGDIRGDFQVSLDVIIAVRPSPDQNNEQASIDRLIEQVIMATWKNWVLLPEGVDGMGETTLQGAQYPGTKVHLARLGSLEI